MSGQARCGSARPMTLEDVLAFPPLSAWRAGAIEPELSPDGQQVVYVHESDLWLVDTEGGEPRCLTQGAAPRWSPVGEQIAFLRGQPPQLWIRESSGSERQMTRLFAGATLPLFIFRGGLAYAWSPDGLRLAIVSDAEGEGGSVEPGSLPETFVEVHRPRLPAGQALWIVDGATGEARQAARTAPGVTWLGLAWSPDGRRLALRENVFRATGGRLQNLLAVIDLETGHVQYPAGQNKRQVFSPAWSPDGTRLAMAYSPHDYIHPFRPVCGVVPADGGVVQCLATDYLLPGLQPVCWHPDNRTLFCCGAHGVSVQVLRIDTVTGAVQSLTDDLGVYDQLRIAADGQWLVCTHRTPRALPEVCLLATDGRERRQLTQVSKRLEEFQLAETAVVRWRTPDGPELEGMLVKPLEYLPGRRYPTIVGLHGGPVAVSQSMAEFYPEWHWLAAQGYLVFAPEFRGSQLFGWDGPPGYNDHNFVDVMA